jgi:hypothetical protein
MENTVSTSGQKEVFPRGSSLFKALGWLLIILGAADQIIGGLRLGLKIHLPLNFGTQFGLGLMALGYVFIINQRIRAKNNKVFWFFFVPLGILVCFLWVLFLGATN